jgi:Holliday junction resolvasome RuvABC endonuclease subunit
MVASLLKLEDVITSEDASDALAIAICHATHAASRSWAQMDGNGRK